MLLQNLAMAERHVAEGERHVQQQRQIVAQLERDGCDASAAKQLLRNFEQSLAVHVAARDRLLKTARESD